MSAHSEPFVLKFHCEGCSQRLSVVSGYEGRKFRCPSCEVENHVPGASPSDLWVDEESLIRFFCEHCEEKLSCEEGGEGREVSCPLCGEATSVPSRTNDGDGSDVLLRSEELVSRHNGTARSGGQGAGQADLSESSSGASALVGGEGKPVNGSEEGLPPGEVIISKEDLFESLKDLGFEVESVAPSRERGMGANERK